MAAIDGRGGTCAARRVEERCLLDGGQAENLPQIVAILGPTAVGKSRVALEMAHRFDAVILSADSRQVYRYMDIGTVKPSPTERAQVPHFMLDVVEPSEAYSAARFAREASRVLTLCGHAHRPVFVVGGTGFYVSALLDGKRLPRVSPDLALRERLRKEAEEHGPQVLHRRLAALDPASAARIHPNNLHRIVRALEIVQTIGGPVPAADGGSELPALHIGLTMDRSQLHDKVDRRIDQQIRRGFVEETEGLLAMGYSATLPALDGFGYRQMVQYLQGRCSLEAAIVSYRTATRQYIRRQMTWFRHRGRIEWMDLSTLAPSALEARVGRYLSTGC